MKEQLFEEYFDLFYDISPNFSERLEVDGVRFLLSSFVKDTYSNIAIIKKPKDMAVAEEVFKDRGLQPVFYADHKLRGREVLYADDFLLLDKLDALYEKYKRLKNEHISLVVVDSPKLEREYCKINDLCFKSESPDNPYPNLDNVAYAKEVLAFRKTETKSHTTAYIIRFKDENVGAIVLTISGKTCYITGFTLLPNMRRTRAFLSMINVLEILIAQKVKTVFCVTELGGYPDKLYQNLGFQSIGKMWACGEKPSPMKK